MQTWPPAKMSSLPSWGDPSCALPSPQALARPAADKFMLAASGGVGWWWWGGQGRVVSEITRRLWVRSEGTHAWVQALGQMTKGLLPTLRSAAPGKEPRPGPMGS